MEPEYVVKTTLCAKLPHTQKPPLCKTPPFVRPPFCKKLMYMCTCRGSYKGGTRVKKERRLLCIKRGNSGLQGGPLRRPPGPPSFLSYFGLFWVVLSVFWVVLGCLMLQLDKKKIPTYASVLQRLKYRGMCSSVAGEASPAAPVCCALKHCGGSSLGYLSAQHVQLQCTQP